MKIITMQPVASSQIEAVGYAPESRTMAIQFKGKGGKPGSVYHYSGVEPETFEALKSAPSVGSYFYKHIKPLPDKYPYTKQATQGEQ